MNLETKITIYKFTPQVFTLTQEISLSIVYYVVKEHCKCSCISAKTSFCNCGLYGCQLRAVQPADGNRMVRNCKTEFIKSYDGII